MVHRVPAWLLCALCLGLATLAVAQEAAPVEGTPAATVKPLQTEVDRPVAPYAVLGSMARLNGGHVSPWDLFTLDTSSWIAGLGAGTLAKDTGVGETLTLAGRTFIRSTDPKTGVKLVEVNKPYPGVYALAMLKPTDAGRVFPRAYRVENAEPALLHSLLENLADDAGVAIGVIGWADMPEAEGIALKRAPIHDKSLTGSEKDAYLETVRATDAHVAFFAVVVPAVLPRPSLNSVLIARHSMEYDAAQGQPAAALVHAHGALIDRAVPADYMTAPLIMDSLRTVGVKDICHLYGFSTVKRGVFLVYRLDYLREKAY
ncbi:MAG TPA: hypothetical protein PLZ36_10285 [Armatimonadota bacterium]|nr:hypothetical protein [Armatimonadota bacterium]HOS43117.1 hypothetical protein [Armatimonadota bacterium]